MDPTLENRKIKLFGFILDLEVFTDISEYYKHSFGYQYKRLFD